MTLVFLRSIACATRYTASCAVRFTRYPYDPGWKSASKIGSRMSLSAPWTTRSRMDGIESWRTLPPSFRYPDFPRPLRSIAPLHQLLAKLVEKALHTVDFDGLERHPVCARGAIVLLGQLIGGAQRL